MTDASVILWGSRIGAVSWDANQGVGVFQYDPRFVSAGIEVSPITMPVREAPYRFPELARGAFKGLPGLLSDALPDSFGTALIDVWLAQTGRVAEDFSPVDRLCYIGRRGVGALEFEPGLRRRDRRRKVEIAQLAELAGRALKERGRLAGWLGGQDDGDALGYGRIEYAYSLMARAAGIEMAECRLHHEGGRSHFMTRRFDRDARRRKIHMQSFGALRHFDYNVAGGYAYEQVMQTIRRLGLGMSVVEEQYRRTVFNIVARNQDDHVKNIAFLMDRRGEWRLSPAYDVAYAHNSRGPWTREHQMSVAGKQSGFERADLQRFAESSGLKKRAAARVVDQVAAAVAMWPRFAADAGVERQDVWRIGEAHRRELC